MANVLMPIIRQRFFDLNGAPLAGGLLYTYLANTVTPYATYVDASGSTPNTNPIVLDADGYCDVYMGVGAYKFVLKDSSGVTIFTRDNVVATSSSGDGSSTPFLTYVITDGQAATDLLGQTLDITKYSSATYAVEIKRGTTVHANGSITVQIVNGTPRVNVGLFQCNVATGVLFTTSTAGSIVQLRAALTTGPGTGTLKLSRTLIGI